ncbi:ATP-grasp domain-containing protein [Nocardiopsis sp. NPDC101807]|uniref:ATP-grasp domain-containing protein n=1 Tax=Nocardiopsis sp. NPDC101807 TaxID=3364339 RepID=UPI0038047006
METRTERRHGMYRIELSDVYGAKSFMNPREPYTGGAGVQGQRDHVTGAMLGMAGETTLLCHSRTLLSENVDLLSAAGMRLPKVLPYSGREEYEEILESLPKSSTVFQHAHPRGALKEDVYFHKRSLLVWLNNKANMGELAPAESVPKRSMHTPGHLLSGASPLGFPKVFKVASEKSLGGGEGVRICFSDDDVRRAAQEFASESKVIIEEYVRVEENWCVNFAISDENDILYLGSANQIVNDAGEYQGNWISGEPRSEVVDLGRHVAEFAAELGYRGFCGFDVVVSESGPKVIDLNFRLNGSTPALCLEGARTGGRSTRLFRSWKCADTHGENHSFLLRLAQERIFIPLTGTFAWGGHSKVLGVLCGESRKEVSAHLDLMKSSGWH